MYIAPFGYEGIKHTGIYFPINFITTAEHVNVDQLNIWESTWLYV